MAEENDNFFASGFTGPILPAKSANDELPYLPLFLPRTPFMVARLRQTSIILVQIFFFPRPLLPPSRVSATIYERVKCMRNFLISLNFAESDQQLGGEGGGRSFKTVE